MFKLVHENDAKMQSGNKKRKFGRSNTLKTNLGN